MALVGNAPRICTRCTKSGIPYVATAVSASFCVLAYLNVSDSGATVFNWFVNLINTGEYMSWISICVIYLRFRKATFVQGITDLPYRSPFQPYVSYLSGSILTILLLVSGFVNFIHGHWNVSNFLTVYIGNPIFPVFYFGHKLFAGRHDAWVLAPQNMDLVSGLSEIIAREAPARCKSVGVNVVQRLWERFFSNCYMFVWLVGWLVVLPVLGVGFLLALVQGCTLVVPCFLVRVRYVEYLGPYCCTIFL